MINRCNAKFLQDFIREGFVVAFACQLLSPNDLSAMCFLHSPIPRESKALME
jgi:hypothetical protein